MGALNWGRDQQRRRVAKQGAEQALAIIPLFGPLTPRGGRPLPLSKAQMRAEAAAALESYQGAVSRAPAGSTGAPPRSVTIRCRCGHMATVPKPRKSARLRCSKCGRRQAIAGR
jgi:hypothetical protein